MERHLFFLYAFFYAFLHFSVCVWPLGSHQQTTRTYSDCAVPKAAAQYLALAHFTHSWVYFFVSLSFAVSCLVFLLQTTKIALIIFDYLL